MLEQRLDFLWWPILLDEKRSSCMLQRMKTEPRAAVRFHDAVLRQQRDKDPVMNVCMVINIAFAIQEHEIQLTGRTIVFPALRVLATIGAIGIVRRPARLLGVPSLLKRSAHFRMRITPDRRLRGQGTDRINRS